MFHLGLFRNTTFAAGNLATWFASITRGGLQFLLIIWLQGIWLPLHGYSYQDTPLWAGIYLLPLTMGFLVAGPISGYLSDHYGVRKFAVSGLLLVAATFLGLWILPVDFTYWQFAALTFFNGAGMGLFTAPNTAAVMGAVPADQRGAASGMRATFMNSGMLLSIGIFFSLMIAGLSRHLPGTMDSGLRAHGVPPDAASRIAHLPPVGSLFSAFLGYNPIGELLGPLTSTLPPGQVSVLTGKEFFPHLMSGPFHDGLAIVFVLCIAMSLIGAAASLVREKPRVNQDGAMAETLDLVDEGEMV
jgi:MFS family permease